MIAVRGACVADLAAITEIYRHYVGHSVATFETVAPDQEYWHRTWTEITDAGWPFLVATAGDAPGSGVLGYAYARAYRPRPAYRGTVEDSIYLAADQRGQGIGTLLLRALLDGLRATPARQVIAVIASEPDAPSDASQRLHTALEFTVSGRLRGVGHKNGRWLDTVLMQYEVPTD